MFVVQLVETEWFAPNAFLFFASIFNKRAGACQSLDPIDAG